MRMIMISKTIGIQICKQERKHTLLDLNFKIQIVQLMLSGRYKNGNTEKWIKTGKEIIKDQSTLPWSLLVSADIVAENPLVL